MGRRRKKRESKVEREKANSILLLMQGEMGECSLGVSSLTFLTWKIQLW